MPTDKRRRPPDYDFSRCTHGTRSTYNYGCRCEDCRAAQRNYVAMLRGELRHRLQQGEEPAHGLSSTYNNWGCRCEPCTRAATAYTRPYKEAYKRQKAEGR